jgi:hypothetical protein
MTYSTKPENQSQPGGQKDIVDDNARKFLVKPLDAAFLEKSKTSFLLATDWLETGEDSERKVAHKTYTNGEIKIFLISKTTKDGRRISERQPISQEEYAKLLEESVSHLEKMRYEFDYEQNGTVFDVKYDVFSNSDLRVLEVDAATEEERNSFELSDFPSKLTEVTGEMQYYGYRVASIV